MGTTQFFRMLYVMILKLIFGKENQKKLKIAYHLFNNLFLKCIKPRKNKNQKNYNNLNNNFLYGFIKKVYDLNHFQLNQQVKELHDHL